MKKELKGRCQIEAMFLPPGRWFSTILVKGMWVPYGKCAVHKEPSGHSTQEDAEKCWYEFVLETIKQSNIPPMYGDECDKCGVQALVVMETCWDKVKVCEEHASLEIFKELAPLEAGRSFATEE